MREYISKSDLEKDNLKLNIPIFCAILTVLVFLMGALLNRFVPKYLDNISILNTFFVLLVLYVFQFTVEVSRYVILYTKNSNNLYFTIKNLVKQKFILINFYAFTTTLACFFTFSLFTLFFSSFRVFFVICSGLILSVVYLFYTMEFSNLVEYNFKKYNFRIVKNNIYDSLTLVFLNSLVIILFINTLNFMRNYYILVMSFILLHLVLYGFNKFYIKSKFVISEGEEL